jgi:vitamin B12 transporter
MYTPKPIKTCLALTVALLASPFAQADNEDSNLAPVIVTASRTAETADQTLAAVNIIDRKQIEQSQATDLTELLAGLAGINLTANGGDGKTKNLYLRGTASSHTLLLIDGIRIGSATLGTPNWAQIPLSDIERIEVVRGPRSSLYGSDAIGGVIQIFTRKGTEGFKPTFELGIGSNNQRRLAGSISDGNSQTRYHLGLSSEKTDGYDTKTGGEPDDDGYDNLSLSGSFSHRFNDRLELSGNLIRAEGENEFDGTGYTGNSTDFLEQSAGLALKGSITESWESTLRVGQSLDEGTDDYNGAFVSRFDTRRDQFSWENSLILGDYSQLIAGFDYLNDQVSSSNAYSVTERDNKALFAQYRYFGDRNDFQLGLRRDDNEQFGGHTTGNIAWGHAIAEGLRLTASAGTAFKAPTFNDLYWPATPWSSGNPDLLPEESTSYELGLNGHNGNTSWAIRAYRTKIDNLIDWACTALCDDADPWNDFWQPSNVSTAEIDGLELEASTLLHGWQARAAINFMDPRDESTGNVLTKRAKRSLRFDLDRDFGKWSLGTTLLAESGRWNNPANTQWLGGYATVDLRASYRITRDWSLRGTVDNLLDRDYETVQTNPMPGRELMLSLIYQPR